MTIFLSSDKFFKSLLITVSGAVVGWLDSIIGWHKHIFEAPTRIRGWFCRKNKNFELKNLEFPANLTFCSVLSFCTDCMELIMV